MNEIERRIARCNMLLNRREAINTRLDKITERLFEDNVPVVEFKDLATEHRNLNVEIDNVENELKTVYKIKL